MKAIALALLLLCACDDTTQLVAPTESKNRIFLVELGNATAKRGENAPVPLVIATCGDCIEDIVMVIHSELEIDVIAEGPHVLSFLRQEGDDLYRVEFEASGCPIGEVARIEFETSGEKKKAYPIKIVRASLRLESGEIVEATGINGKVRVR